MSHTGVWDCTYRDNTGSSEFMASLNPDPFHPGITNTQNDLGRSNTFSTLASLKNNPARFSNPQIHPLSISN